MKRLDKVTSQISLAQIQPEFIETKDTEKWRKSKRAELTAQLNQMLQSGIPIDKAGPKIWPQLETLKTLTKKGTYKDRVPKSVYNKVQRKVDFSGLESLKATVIGRTPVTVSNVFPDKEDTEVTVKALTTQYKGWAKVFVLKIQQRELLISNRYRDGFFLKVEDTDNSTEYVTVTGNVLRYFKKWDRYREGKSVLYEREVKIEIPLSRLGELDIDSVSSYSGGKDFDKVMDFE